MLRSSYLGHCRVCSRSSSFYLAGGAATHWGEEAEPFATSLGVLLFAPFVVTSPSKTSLSKKNKLMVDHQQKNPFVCTANLVKAYLTPSGPTYIAGLTFYLNPWPYFFFTRAR